ncbi:hypothetical protein G3N30_07645 [Microbacterium lacticum]|uniref:hypothetical protein n=1 Tax=Microbacterium lacticum TaxID=33885 RepID=UPI0018B0DC31|nr:hypothetical protein [Microbacterium lacticum]MBF9336102.1 hypothetical protein [Microbacterium lacticum]
MTSVTVVAAGDSRVLYNDLRDHVGRIHEAAALVETLLRSGTWRISFPEVPDRAPMVYDRGVAWRRLVAFRTDLIIEEAARPERSAEAAVARDVKGVNA